MNFDSRHFVALSQILGLSLLIFFSFYRCHVVPIKINYFYKKFHYLIKVLVQVCEHKIVTNINKNCKRSSFWLLMVDFRIVFLFIINNGDVWSKNKRKNSIIEENLRMKWNFKTYVNISKLLEMQEIIKGSIDFTAEFKNYAK